MKPARLSATMLAIMLPAVALWGCGSSSPSITEGASNQLQLQVQAVRNAAATYDRSLAEARLAELRRTLTELRDRHKISGDRATKVLDAAAEVEAQLQAIPTTTTTTTTTPAAPTPTRGKGDHGKDNKGKGGG